MKTAAFISIAIGLSLLGAVEAIKAGQSTPPRPLKGYPEFTCERLEAELREQEALEMLYPEDLEAIIKRCYELFGS
jgi:hypothetical protein